MDCNLWVFKWIHWGNLVNLSAFSHLQISWGLVKLGLAMAGLRNSVEIPLWRENKKTWTLLHKASMKLPSSGKTGPILLVTKPKNGYSFIQEILQALFWNFAYSNSSNFHIPPGPQMRKLRHRQVSYPRVCI